MSVNYKAGLFYGDRVQRFVKVSSLNKLKTEMELNEKVESVRSVTAQELDPFVQSLINVGADQRFVEWGFQSPWQDARALIVKKN